MKSKSLAVALIIAAGLWFWLGAGQEGPTEEEQLVQRNAQLIKKCIDRQETLNAAARSAGDDSIAVDAREFCADKHQLFDSQGEWHPLEINEDDVWSQR